MEGGKIQVCICCYIFSIFALFLAPLIIISKFKISLSWQYGVHCDLPKETDLHIHFPAGAIGKDGPSAGVAIAVALFSLYCGRCVRSDTAMTGEITLRGLVLPVGPPEREAP